MGIAAPKVIWPVEDTACRMPTEAEEDWIMAVSTAPASTPKMGLVNTSSSSRKLSISFSPATAVLMVSMPNINVAKPRRIIPVSFFLPLLPIIYSATPIRAKTGVKDVGLRSCMKKLSLWMPERLRIHAVTVVPTLAPIIT